MLTQGIEVMKYVRASAGRSGIRIEFEETNQPRHDGKTIYLPRITGKTTEDELKQLMASTDHEVAHDRFSCFNVLKEKDLDPNGFLMFVWNFLEDSRVNMIEAKEYRGFRDNWDACGSSLLTKILGRSSKEMSVISAITSSLICWEGQLSSEYFPSIGAVTAHFPANKDITNVLNNYSDRLRACHEILDKRLGTESTYDLALEILTKLGHDCNEKLKKLAKASEKPGEGKKEPAKGVGTESTKPAPTTGDTKTEGEGEGEPSEETKDEDYRIIKVVITEEDLKKFSVTAPEEGSKMSKVGINFDPIRSTSGWDLTDYEKFIVVDYPKSIGNRKYFNDYYADSFINEYEHRVGKKLVAQENFAQQVRRLIQIRAKVQTQYGTKKGKLDQSRLSRICFNAPGLNERVFKRKIENKTLDAAVTVLVDMSGSMGGDKVYYALASALLMNEVCSTLNIPLEVIGFSDDRDEDKNIQPTMFVYKGFNNLKVTPDEMTKYFALSSNYMQGNPDGENILWAHDRLIKRKEKKKLLIVMSDGNPCASKSSHGLDGFTRDVIQEIEKAKQVDIYGLGLLSPAVRSYYKAHSVVDTEAQIPSKLLALIEKKILYV